MNTIKKITLSTIFCSILFAPATRTDLKDFVVLAFGAFAVLGCLKLWPQESNQNNNLQLDDESSNTAILESQDNNNDDSFNKESEYSLEENLTTSDNDATLNQISEDQKETISLTTPSSTLEQNDINDNNSDDSSITEVITKQPWLSPRLKLAAAGISGVIVLGVLSKMVYNWYKKKQKTEEDNAFREYVELEKLLS